MPEQAQPRATEDSPRTKALGALRVLDLTDERAIYGAKLMADLGADVVRPVPPDGDPLRLRGPHAGDDSLWYAFFASNRTTVTLDSATAEGREKLGALVDRADVILACDGAFGASEARLAEARAGARNSW